MDILQYIVEHDLSLSLSLALLWSCFVTSTFDHMATSKVEITPHGGQIPTLLKSPHMEGKSPLCIPVPLECDTDYLLQDLTKFTVKKKFVDKLSSIFIFKFMFRV